MKSFMPINSTMDHKKLRGISALTLHGKAPLHYNSSFFLDVKGVEIDSLSLWHGRVWHMPLSVSAESELT